VVNAIDLEDTVKLNARLSKKELKEPKKEKKELLSKEILRPIPDGEFENLPFSEDTSKDVKI
ncbi:hypothetical protein A2U01_0100405, partial [Trifolium medium]|nr:hypothetical protein [Trifolium medium]